MVETKQYEELKQLLVKTATDIDGKVLAMNAKAEAGEKIGKENTAELQGLLSKFSTMQKDLDDMALSMKRTGSQFSGEGKTPMAMLTEHFEKSKDFENFARIKKGNFSIEIPEVKATQLTASVAPGTVILPTYVPGIVMPNLRRPTVLDIIPTAPTSQNAVHYVQETSYTSNAAYVAEGELKPEDAAVLSEVTAPVQTLAALMRVSKQLLDDLPALLGYITMRGPRKLQQVKESAVLFGAGGSSLTGITTVAAGFNPGSDVIVQAPNRVDVLGAAALQATLAEYVANGAVIHSTDLYLLKHAKDTQNRYLFPELRESGTIDGLRITETRLAAMKGKFLVGDFEIGAQLFQRQGLTIEMFDQDRDNVARNLITIRMEERHALATYRPDAFVYGTFAAAITDLTS
jgi:HK97 family phage major capsid protein